MRPVQNRDIGNIIIAGILVAIVSQILATVEAFMTMEIYLMEEFFPVWSRIMMPSAGPPPVTFFLYSIGFSLILGILYAAVFRVIEESIPGTGIQKGLCYGFILFLLSGVPFLLTTYLLINLPAQFFAAGAVFGFIGYILYGIVINAVVGC
jgi:hypothetical protein